MADDESELFSLRWNNFHSNLTSGFHDLLQGENLVDVTLAAGGQVVQAHKLVLSVCSPYFKELFMVNPCRHPIVILKDVLYKDLVAILQFMYKGEVNVRQEELTNFLKTAETLQIKGLTGESGDESLGPLDNLESLETPHPVENTNRRSFKRSNPVPPTQVRRPPSPPQRPAKRNRLELPASSSLVPITTQPTATEPSTVPPIEFLRLPALTTPKEEPLDYESDIEVLDGKSEAMIQLLGGELSQSRNDDTDSSHQSHFDTSSLSSHHNLSQPHQDGNQSQEQGPGTFAGIAGISQTPDGLQMTPDGSQDSNVHATCHVCWKTVRKASLRRHILNRHTPCKPLFCTVCGKVYKTENSLKKHNDVYHQKEKELLHEVVVEMLTPDNLA